MSLTTLSVKKYEKFTLPKRPCPLVVDFYIVLLSVIAAKRVARRRDHHLQTSSLRVQLLLDPESLTTEDEDGPNSVSIIVTIVHQKMCN